MHQKFKSSSASPSIVTRDLVDFSNAAGSLYEAVYIISERSKQIGIQLKDELTNKLADFSTSTDNLEEVFENREQIELSKFYEKLPKPTTLATEELLNGDLDWEEVQEDEVQAAITAQMRSEL